MAISQNRPALRSVTRGGDPIIMKMKSFLGLAEGWLYGRGKPMSRESYIAGLSVYQALDFAGAQRFEVFPAEDGELLVSGYADGIAVDVLCKGNATFDVTIEKDEGDVEYASITFDRLRRVLSGIKWPRAKFSDSFIRYTTATNRDVSKVSRSVNQEMMARLSSTRIVRSGLATANAAILKSTTKTGLPDAPLFFYESKLRDFRLRA